MSHGARLIPNGGSRIHNPMHDMAVAMMVVVVEMDVTVFGSEDGDDV